MDLRALHLLEATQVIPPHRAIQLSPLQMLPSLLDLLHLEIRPSLPALLLPMALSPLALHQAILPSLLDHHLVIRQSLLALHLLETRLNLPALLLLMALSPLGLLQAIRLSPLDLLLPMALYPLARIIPPSHLATQVSLKVLLKAASLRAVPKAASHKAPLKAMQPSLLVLLLATALRLLMELSPRHLMAQLLPRCLTQLSQLEATTQTPLLLPRGQLQVGLSRDPLKMVVLDRTAALLRVLPKEGLHQQLLPRQPPPRLLPPLPPLRPHRPQRQRPLPRRPALLLRQPRRPFEGLEN